MRNFLLLLLIFSFWACNKTQPTKVAAPPASSSSAGSISGTSSGGNSGTSSVGETTTSSSSTTSLENVEEGSGVAPGNFTVTRSQKNLATLKWDDVKLSAGEVDGYVIYREDENTKRAILDSVASGEGFYQDSTIGVNTDASIFTYRIAAYKGSSSNLVSQLAEYTVGDEPEEGREAAPSNLQVSIFSGNTIVLTWSDIQINKNEYDGYVIYRNDNYDFWDLKGTQSADQGFYRDESIKDQEHKYLYKIAAYKGWVDEGDSIPALVSQWSDEVGTLALKEIGFEPVTFESPSTLNALRYGPTRFSLGWKHSGKAPELGFVLQWNNELLRQTAYLRDTAGFVQKGNCTGSEGQDSTCYAQKDTTYQIGIGDWLDLDTTGSTDNHVTLYESTPGEVFRVYAYFLNDFEGIISEFTDEVSLPVEYCCGIEFTPVTTVEVDTSQKSLGELRFSWKTTHNAGNAIEISRNIDYADAGSVIFYDSYRTYYKWEGITGDINTAAIKVRVVWTSLESGLSDATDWSDDAGTRPDLASTILTQ